MQSVDSPLAPTVVRARSRARQLAPLLLVALASACSPVSFARHARSAERAVGLAEAARADEHARYEVTMARLLLDKAREQSGSAHYASALDLVQRAERSATRAQLLARARGGHGGMR
ncbi:MAG: hypothetical protein ABW252_01270 [Polyangiales bacterium]